jgi:hypothetical protein
MPVEMLVANANHELAAAVEVIVHQPDRREDSARLDDHLVLGWS